MALITAETAREMSAKGNYARWHAPRSEPPPATPEPQPPRLPAVNPTADLLRVKKQIDSIYDMMDEAAHGKTVDCPHCKKPVEVGADSRELDQLSRAYDRLFKAWQVLSATPGPGQRKPATIRGRNNASGPGGFHVPAEPSNCGPDTTTGSVPTENPKSETPQG